MPSQSRSQSRAVVASARQWMLALLVVWPAAAMAQTSPAVSTLVAFSGSQTSAGPVRGPDGALYGTTSTVNFITGGLIYRLEADGSRIQTLYQFKLSDGFSPFGGLMLGSDGRLYGTTSLGAVTEANTGGTIFGIDADGEEFKVLHRFASYAATNPLGGAINADGASPESELIEGNDGFLYGVTRAGGPGGTGAVFKVSRDGTAFTVLHTFGAITSDAGVAPAINADGINPSGPLVAGADNFFYGTASAGGANGFGTLFRVGFDGSGFEVLRSFPALVPSTTTGPTNADGAVPLAGLTDGQDGRLYGVASQGGSAGSGTLFALDPLSRVFTVLHEFDGSKGAAPTGELLLAQDGKLYGTTASGGSNAAGEPTLFGTIFSIARDGTGFTSLHSFKGTDGSSPSGKLLQLNASTFAGATLSGGNCSQGTVFQLSLTGATAKGVTNCGRRNNNGGGGVAPILLLLLALAAAARRAAAR
jgi:uncharacterized repeat protein (TIGR03803 family)